MGNLYVNLSNTYGNGNGNVVLLQWTNKLNFHSLFLQLKTDETLLNFTIMNNCHYFFDRFIKIFSKNKKINETIAQKMRLTFCSLLLLKNRRTKWTSGQLHIVQVMECNTRCRFTSMCFCLRFTPQSQHHILNWWNFMMQTVLFNLFSNKNPNGMCFRF